MGTLPAGRGTLLMSMLLGSIATVTLFGQGTQAQAPAKPPATSTNAASTEDLVAAAKASKAKRTTSGKKKVITNADVKKSKGKLILISTSDSKPGQKQDTVDAPPTAEQNEARMRDRKEAEERLAAAEKLVDELKIELVRAEQKYYESSDPAFRERALRERFDAVRKQLDDAMIALDDARDALAATDPKR
jgi:hypothetical protein